MLTRRKSSVARSRADWMEMLASLHECRVEKAWDIDTSHDAMSVDDFGRLRAAETIIGREVDASDAAAGLRL